MMFKYASFEISQFEHLARLELFCVHAEFCKSAFVIRRKSEIPIVREIFA